ncbi:MAG: PAS domain S-box protein [Nitrospira sp.]|nr:PAS domain S-box protein [Nitrospira sp.]MDH4304920.1 PAS domain S-box protein [Nitrospira sp.]MDH5194237.1 PAS domain S-box protein [Nitrospira sp.]
MAAGLFLGMLLLLSLALWRVFRLQRENLRKAQVIEGTQCGVLVTDATLPHHPIREVNGAFLALTGYAEYELIGQTCTILSGPDTDRASMETLGLGLQDGWACRVCVRHYRRDGTSFWNEVTLSPIKDRAGRLTEVIWIMRDVSHVRALEADRSGRLAPTLLCESVSEGVLVVTDGDVVYVNMAGLRILGASSDAHVVGQAFLGLIHQEFRERVREQLVRISSPDTECQWDTNVLRLDGGTVAVEMSITPIVWEGQESFLICFSDRVHVNRKGDDVAQGLQDLRRSESMTEMNSWAWDVAQGTELWSAEQYRILGYEPGSVPPTYDTFKNALHPEDRDRVLALFEETFTSDRPYDIDCRIIQPSGVVRFVRCRGVLMHGLPDQPIRMSGTLEDITDYKLMATLAEERVLQLKVVLDASSSGMALVSREGTISLANRKLEQMFGYVYGELVGRPVDSLFQVLDRARYAREFREVLSVSGDYLSRTGVELHSLRKDGSRFPTEIGLYPIVLSSGPSLLVSMVDITDRHQVEQTLRDDRMRLDLAVQVGQVGVFEYDHRADSVWWSPILRTIHGIGTEEQASLERYLQLVHPSDRDSIAVMVRSVKNPDEDRIFEVSYRIVRPDGAIRKIDLCYVTWFDQGDSAPQPCRTVGMLVDSTDRKPLTTVLPHLPTVESQQTIPRTVFHEFNNSLTAVLGFSELACSLIPMDNKAHRHILQVIAAGRNVRELAHTIRRALEPVGSHHESIPPSQPGSDPSPSQPEVPDVVGPCR